MNSPPAAPSSELSFYYHVYNEIVERHEKYYLKINTSNQEIKIENINNENTEVNK